MHAKLSGAYLSCIRMKSRVDCRNIYEILQRKRAQNLHSKAQLSNAAIRSVIDFMNLILMNYDCPKAFPDEE